MLEAAATYVKMSSSQPLNNRGDGLSKLLELFNHILQTVLWQILSYMFGNVAQ